MDDYARDAVALLDHLGVREAVVCGLSMGGYAAFALYRLAGERVRGLVLMDTRAEADSPEARRARDQQIALAREQGAAAIAETMVSRLLAPETLRRNPAVAEQVRAMMVATPVSGIAGALAAMRDRPDSTAMLGSLEGLPTLVVVGEHDELMSPASHEALAAAIPGAKLAVIPGAGHLPPLETPEAVTHVLGAFLRKLG